MRGLASSGDTGRQLGASIALLVLIGPGCDDGRAVPPAPVTCGLPAPLVDCRAPEACPQIAVNRDAPATTPGVFKGFADPTVASDPIVPGRIWLAYSWPHILPGRAPDGATAFMAAVSTHLARSDDGGRSFGYVSEPWPALRTSDPEGGAEDGVLSSETPALVAMSSGGQVTWYGAHLRYFLRPETGYNPNYATSWHVRIGAAPSPPDLATAEEAVLGVSATAEVYRPDVRLDELAGLPLTRCAMLNNPALYTSGGTLYLVVECLAFTRTARDFEGSTLQLFATEPVGHPRAWTWRHAGALAGHELALELGADTTLQPEITRAADGTPLVIVTPAEGDETVVVGATGEGCVSLELAALEPPTLRRNRDGCAIVRASITGMGIGACTHDPASLTGIIATSKFGDGNWTIHASGVRP